MRSPGSARRQGVQHRLRPRAGRLHARGSPPAGRVHRWRRRRGQGARVVVRRDPRAAPARRRRPEERSLARRNERVVDARHVRQGRPQQQLLHRPHRPRLTIRTFSIRTEDADIGHPAAICGARGGEELHIQFHFTPFGSSWINQIETWSGIITRQSIRRGTFSSVNVLKRDHETLGEP
ncbi:hypothetical protein SCOCK_70176 [Actinacidiphila cocklensis]|uniref:Tc1-like transposase DDE domain-containing protein n=1 Tax=Actinacidiphila cocklensis TaxID=887465 RepID=A0A9W4E016_9ACTN|nr:hypothetical protein SCOCK_70176 [Actinacidiphila cocklensis]